MRFACFSGAAAVADEAEAVARHRRGKFFFANNKGDKSPSRPAKASSPRTKTKRVSSPGRRDTDFDIYDMIAARKSTTSSSALSTAASLDSAYSSLSSSSSFSTSRSSSSSSLSSLDAMPPQPAKTKRLQPDEQKRSPAVGAAAVLVCLVMMMFGGRLVATLLTAAVLCFFPRQCRHAASRREAIDRKAVTTDGFLGRNRNK